MGLAAELEYTYRRPNFFHRTMQAFAETRFGAWFFAKTLARMDRVLAKLTHDRVTVPAVMARLPVLVLTSTGRKSGQLRETHLIAVPFRDTLALLGTNFGQPKTPAWVLNLEDEPRAKVAHHGITRDVVARPADATERAQILADSPRYYGGYVKYQQRITGRTVRIFVLEPASHPVA
ncbi:MAG TPA: nitroreductase family deazaflavin-dependent oxidoreductase [Jatrophihabitans sp.]|nr:nitroreductase family deazaflavin-dependent oxidoreductase [Jatrophihabitans sp.]